MDIIELPPAPTEGTALTAVLKTRRSRRDFSEGALSDEHVSLLLWAAHGVTSADGRRTAPSAGFTDPMTVMALTPSWRGTYRGDRHVVEVAGRDDVRRRLVEDPKASEMLGSAGLIVVLAACVERTAARYGDRAVRYVTLEAGHIAQNVLLAAESVGLWAVPVGSFDDDRIRAVLGLSAGDLLLYLLPIGHPATR